MVVTTFFNDKKKETAALGDCFFLFLVITNFVIQLSSRRSTV